MQLVDVAGEEELTDRGDASADANVFIARGLGGFLQRGVDSSGDKVKSGAAFHSERLARVMGEDEDGHVVGRIWTPPALPELAGFGIGKPRAADGSEHVAAEDPGADVVERCFGEIVIDAGGAGGSAGGGLGGVGGVRIFGLRVNLVEDFGLEEPFVEFESADTEGICEVLAGAGAEAVEGEGEGGDFEFGHGAGLVSMGRLYARGSWEPAS